MATVKGFKVGNDTLLYQDRNLANEFSTNNPYKVGDYVINPDDGKLYKCTVDIAVGENWDITKWAEVRIGDEVDDLKSALNEQIIISSTQPTSENNKIWIDSDETSVQVPTYAEYLSVENMPTSVTGAWCTRFSVDQLEEVTVEKRKFRKRQNVFLLQGTGGTAAQLAINLTGSAIIPYAVESTSNISLRATDIVKKEYLITNAIKFFRPTASGQSYYIIYTCHEDLTNPIKYEVTPSNRTPYIYIQDLTNLLADANDYFAIYFYSKNLAQSVGYHAFEFT